MKISIPWKISVGKKCQSWQKIRKKNFANTDFFSFYKVFFLFLFGFQTSKKYKFFFNQLAGKKIKFFLRIFKDFFRNFSYFFVFFFLTFLWNFLTIFFGILFFFHFYFRKNTCDLYITKNVRNTPTSLHLPRNSSLKTQIRKFLFPSKFRKSTVFEIVEKIKNHKK